MTPALATAAAAILLACAALAARLFALARAKRMAEADSLLVAPARPAESERSRSVPAALAAAGLDLTAGEWVAARVLAAAAGALAAYALAPAPAAAAAGALAGPVAAHLWLRARTRARKSLFDEQFARALPQIAQGMRAGQTAERSIMLVGQSSDEPLRSELMRSVRELAVNPSLAAALGGMAERTGSKDVRLLATAARIHAERGGNLAETIEAIADTLARRLEMGRLVKSETASAKASMRIAAAFPLLVLAIQCATQESYAEFYLETPAGWAVLAVAALLDAAGAAVMARMADVKFE